MKAYLSLLLFCIFTLTNSVSPDFISDDNVIILNENNFAPALEQFRYTLLHFYDPAFTLNNADASEYAKAAQKIKTLYPGVKLCKMDGKKYKGYADIYDIKEFPAIKFFNGNDDDPIDYNGGKKSNEIVTWIKNKLESTILRPETIDDIKGLLSKYENLGVFVGTSSSKGYSTVLGAMSLTNNLTFIMTNLKEVKDKYKVKKDNTFIFLKSDDDEKSAFSNPTNIDKLVTWIDACKYSYMPFNKEAMRRIFDKGIDAMFLIRSKDSSDNYAEKALKTAARSFQGKFSFSSAVFEETYGSRLAKFLGINKEDLPAVIILHATNKDTKYVFNREITSHNLEVFLNNFFQDNLVPFYRSAPIPQEDYDGNVRVVVGKNFKEVVIDEDKDVLVEFYLPSCSHCQRFAPIYQEIASEAKEIGDIVIAKIDGGANDVENVNIVGYPTMFLYRKGRKEAPIEFKGDPTKIRVLRFIEDNLTVQKDDNEDIEFFK